MSSAAMVNLEEKCVIFTEGQTDTHLYKIVSGKVGLYRAYGTADETLVGTSSAPGYLGTMNALASCPATYTAVTMTKTMLLQLPREELGTFAKSDPAASLAVMKKMARQLSERDEELRLLISELKELCGAWKPDRRALQDVMERYEESVREGMILDEYEAYLPTPKEASASITMIVPSDTELYLPGHKGYPGITHPEYKKYLISVEYTCPHCQHTFRAGKILLSHLVPVHHETEELRYDLRVTYRDFEAEWYEIITCPHCWFSSFENYFREQRALYKFRYEAKLAQFYSENSMDFEAERDLDFVFAQHYLALICAPGFADSRQIQARVWMNLIRLYQDAGEEKLSLLAEKKTVEAYHKVYMECDLQSGQEQNLCLTMAGMLYARGEKKEARAWAMMVRTSGGERSAYWHMAEQLIQDVRAELAEENG